MIRYCDNVLFYSTFHGGNVSEPMTIPELFNQWFADNKVADQANAKASVSEQSLRAALTPLIAEATKMVNQENPGNIHITIGYFVLIDQKGVWISINHLRRADTMKDLPAEIFGRNSNMSWLRRIEQIFIKSMDLGPNIKVTCVVDGYYTRDTK